jgi:GNAT superfamily N-acetyltransferase
MDGVTFRDLVPGDAGWVAMRHGALYHRDEGFGIRFEALVLGLLAEFIETRGPQERAWIAVDARGRRLGCVFCTRPSPEEAKLRMFLVEPEARGTGLGPALLEAVVEHAKATGAARLVLWTHESHRAAGRLYARRGFQLIDQRPVVAWGQPTAEQNWVLDLEPDDAARRA